jgi:hypothetical protein
VRMATLHGIRMAPSRTTTRAAVALAALVAIGVAAASALGGVTVYKNSFNSKSDAKELRHAEGKHCARSLRKKAGNLRVDVTKSPETCGYRPPVEGDTDRPDHTFVAKVRFLHNRSAGLRKHAYVAISVRSGRTSGYELRVFPVKHRFRLVRNPSGGGHDFPAKGTSKAIKGFNKANVLSLKAVGSKVTASVNGAKVAKATDSNAAQVGGRKAEVAIGSGKRSSRTVSATVDDLKLQVPTP